MEPTDAEFEATPVELRRGMPRGKVRQFDLSRAELERAVEAGRIKRRRGLEAAVWHALLLRGETVH